MSADYERKLHRAVAQFVKEADKKYPNWSERNDNGEWGIGLDKFDDMYKVKSGVLKKTVKDIVFEINFFSSKWNESGQSIEINAELRLIYKTYGKLPVDNVVASMSYQPENGYWYDISTESRLLETRNILEKRFQETAMDLVHRFENNYHSAVQYLFFEGFEKYDVHLDFIAEHLGQEAIKDKAHQIYVGLSDEVKEQIVQYQNGARNKTWMLNRCNLKYIVDNDIYLQ